MSIDVSPDGKTLIFDLLGDIYKLPFEGGEAIALTSGQAWDQAPIFSEDGEYIYFVSDRKGFKNIWRLKVADRLIHQVTRSPSDVMGTPNWSQYDSKLLAGIAEVYSLSPEVILHSIDPTTGKAPAIDAPTGPWVDLNLGEVLRSAMTIFSAVQSVDGEIFFSQSQRDEALGRTVVRLYKFDPATQTRTALTPRDALFSEYKPQLSHDGRLLAYFRQYTDRRTEIRVLNRRTGRDEALYELTGAEDAYYAASHDSRPNYTFSPGDRYLILWHGGKIVRVSVAGGVSEIVPFHVNVERTVATRVQPKVRQLSDVATVRTIRWPGMSRDAHRIVFAAVGYIWVMNLETGAIRRLTGATDFEYMPAISPNGKSVAYVSYARTRNVESTGRLMIANLDGGTPRELLAAQGATYLIPEWSLDGNRIAVIREVDAGSVDGAAFGWTPVVEGEFHGVAPLPGTNVYMARHIYARFVGFDTTGNNLLFSYPRSRKESVLATTDLNGDGFRILAVGKADVGGIAPAPDLKHLTLTKRDKSIWVIPFTREPEPTVVSTISTEARLVNAGGGYYVDWIGPDQFIFGFGQDLYRYHVGKGKLESLRVGLTLDRSTLDRPIVFKGARLITMSDDSTNVIERGNLVVVGRRIVAIGPTTEVEIPSDAIVIDVAGKTIMPGLLDTHYHKMGGRSYSAYGLPNPLFSDLSATRYGITTAWEPGGAMDDGVPAIADLQASGRIQGPRWFYAGEGGLSNTWDEGGANSNWGEPITYGVAFVAVDRRRRLGASVIKEYETPTRQQRQWLSSAARELGLGIISHIDCYDCMMTRIVDGYTGGDHSYISVPFYKDVREMLRQTGYIWTPNVVITGGSIGTDDAEEAYYWQALLRKPPEETRKLNGITISELTTRIAGVSPIVPYDRHRIGRVAQQAAAAHRAGVHIGVSAHNMPASNIHREMWHLWKGGMAISDVLRASTIGNAEKLGLQDEIGTLDAGKIADFIVLDLNPLDDILNTRSLKYTVQGGIVFDSDTAQRVNLVEVDCRETGAEHRSEPKRLQTHRDNRHGASAERLFWASGITDASHASPAESLSR